MSVLNIIPVASKSSDNKKSSQVKNSNQVGGSLQITFTRKKTLNCTLHTIANLYILKDARLFPLPPFSPSLSSIKHVYDRIEHRLHSLPSLRSENEFWQIVDKKRRAFSRDTNRNLIFYVSTPVATYIANGNGPTTLVDVLAYYNL
ncbi:hypothetical protein TNCV_1859991 [Trichonephila clavipes]|nr:hypothetical protein TNCV_1859991 [Trichonephila clavipes]